MNLNLNLNLPFLRFFKKVRSSEAATAVVSQPIIAIEKPASERFGKTVMPNVTRIVGVDSPVDFNLPTGVGGTPAVASLVTAPLPGADSALSAATLAPPTPRRISLGGNGGLASPPKKPIVPDLSDHSGAERTIALQLTDVAPHIPAGLLKPEQIDPAHRLLLKAADLERGMSSGRPNVPLRAIYQQAREFFIREVEEADQSQVTLPFSKVLEQFAAFQVRPDQLAQQALPQVDTPFLQVTLEDSKRFGTPATPVAAPEPTAQPEPKTAPVAEIQSTAPIRLPLPKEVSGSASAPVPVRPEEAPPHPPIAVRVSPNGTGVPASERVPASSGSPVPTSLPSPFASTPPARIPFKISRPTNDPPEPTVPDIQSLRPETGKVEFSAPRLRLPLRTIMRGIAPVQLSGPIDEVAEGAMLELPFSIVEPQLRLGRIAISPAEFQAGLPEEYRASFKIEDSDTPIPLPLQDVLQNLPNESMQLRGDQEAPEIVSLFETPFSQKAAEDATRLKSSPAPIVKPAVASDAVKPVAVAPAHRAGGPSTHSPRPYRSPGHFRYRRSARREERCCARQPPARRERLRDCLLRRSEPGGRHTKRSRGRRALRDRTLDHEKNR